MRSTEAITCLVAGPEGFDIGMLSLDLLGRRLVGSLRIEGRELHRSLEVFEVECTRSSEGGL